MKLYTNYTLPDPKKQKMVARFIFDGMHVEEIKKLLRKEFEKIRFITDDDSSIIALRKVPNIPIINRAITSPVNHLATHVFAPAT